MLINERMDAVKEYLAWRQIPRDLGIRVRRYYEFFFTHKPIFDEGLILGELNPQLHSEVVQKILSGTVSASGRSQGHATLCCCSKPASAAPHVPRADLPSEQLGKLPIFHRLDPDFRLALFPLLKPISYMPGEVIFRKGDASRDLMFLLEGEVRPR